MCFYLYIILSTTVSVLDLKDAILFLQCLPFYFCSFCVHFHYFLQVQLHVCYVCNVIRWILLMTDSLNVV